MIAGKAQKKYKRVWIELSPQAVDLIDQLLATGLHGLSRNEVCERFVLEKLRERVGLEHLPAVKTRLGCDAQRFGSIQVADSVSDEVAEKAVLELLRTLGYTCYLGKK